MRVVLAVLFGVLLVGDASPAAAADPAAIDRAADRVLDGRFQRLDDLEEAARRREAQARQRPERDARDDRRERRGGGGVHSWEGGPGALSPILSALVWGALGVVAVLVVLWLVRELVRGRRARPIRPASRAREEAAPGAPEGSIGAALDAPLDDADRLAADGRFAEAIHVLLLRTLEELVRVSDTQIPAHLTSREILARIWLRPDARDALAELVRMVELTWFGDDVPGEAEWQRCRDQFDRFVAAYRAGAAPAAAPAPAEAA